MILKNTEINRFNSLKKKIVLMHGKNDGLKNEKINEIIQKNKDSKIERYEEKEILENKNIFFDNILNKSLFDEHKLIIINRSTDKLLIVLDDLLERNLLDITFIIIADILDKKSKLRSLFEKEKDLISIAFYTDTNETLIKLAQIFFREKNIPISFENINIIVNKCSGDRGNLNNELEKISSFSVDKKKLEIEDLMKLINLSENHSINELADTCLSKNKKKTINILSENNYGPEDSMLIIRTFLNKSKKLLNLLNDYEINKDLNRTILNAKPPIFWKDKDIIKQQLKIWKPKKIQEFIYNLNGLETQVKKTSLNPLYLINDFILDVSSSTTNN
jgi:DNA polymerase-3 subunit delta